MPTDGAPARKRLTKSDERGAQGIFVSLDLNFSCHSVILSPASCPTYEESENGILFIYRTVDKPGNFMI